MTKPTKWHVRPAKTQISLGIRPVWSESSLSLISLGIRPVWSESSLSAWRTLGSLATRWAHSEDSDWADAQSDLSRRWAHRFVMRWLILQKLLHLKGEELAAYQIVLVDTELAAYLIILVDTELTAYQVVLVDTELELTWQFL